MKVRASLLLSLLLILGSPAPGEGQGTRLLQKPDVSREAVTFAYGGDLWIVSRDGGTARRLTSTPGVETDPHFSPDGTRVAFTATVAGNTDVYVMPARGGDPRRLTHHPGNDVVRGWTPDGESVVFASSRATPPTGNAYFRMWTVGSEGGFPTALPMPRAFDGVFSPGGDRLAYEEYSTAFLPEWEWEKSSQWRHYRGGRTHPVRIMHLGDHSVEELPWTDSNDTDPMWVGRTIYFLSDRNHTVNLFAYRTDTGELTQLTQHSDFDIMNASAGPDAVVYEQAGYIHLVDAETGQSRQLSIEVRGDFPWARPQQKEAAGMIRNAALSPTGVRVAFEARGEIFTVPAGEEGDVRNLTRSSGAHDRSPVWSPDGERLAWLSDESGEYRLMVGDQTGLGEAQGFPLPSTAFFSEPAWSPDGRHLLLTDNHLNLWVVEVASGRARKIDTDTYVDPRRSFDAVWSPDSRWVAYSKGLASHQRAIFVYSVEEERSYQLSDGMADAVAPAFDASGRYLYFLASTDYGLNSQFVEMSSVDRPVTRAVYLVVLRAGEPSPLLPDTGDEPGTAPGGESGPVPAAEQTEAPGEVRIDFDDIGQRILALDVPPGDYGDLKSAAAGTIFFSEAGESGQGQAARRLLRYRLEGGEIEPFLDGIVSYGLSSDGNKLLYRTQGNQWGVVPTTGTAQPGQGLLRVQALETRIDPRAEWAQIFRETWRIQREFFYDPEMHGADWQAIYEKYRPLVDHVRHRDDLGYLIATVGGELAVGHSYLTGQGDVPDGEPVSVGMLGADYSVDAGHYRIRRIYDGENWNPDLRAPLREPGIDVAEGDYLLEVNGEPLEAPTNLYSLFEGTAGEQTLIRVNDEPRREGSRVETVVPVASEAGLRTRAWVEQNRRLVDSLSAGRLAYVWLPNTSTPGYDYFNRYYYAQQDKAGAVIDERYNQGGMVADYIVDELARERMGYFATRGGEPSTSPAAGIYGPKVMVINESAGSGGDALPYYFRLRGLGPLVGTRTWGALVGTLGVPATIDGGGITAPTLAFFDLDGEWAVENEGVAPDIQVEQTPAEVIRGRDPQLERAVEEALRLLGQNPARSVSRPPPIDRVSNR